ncbi:hypothetical protein DVH24_032228 [Malus domestica]|uniref:Uncharacterized protein n=1 Tax=Malus domestica TaxID=3750 RepID=A0A498J8Z6_MALDO|nr:hypothetical protein DVH24_032228 [Malus domestica]
MGFKVVENNNAETGSGALFEIKLVSLLVLIVTKLTLTLVLVSGTIQGCIQFLYSLSRLVHVFQLDIENVEGSNPFILAGQAAPLLAESPPSPAHTLINKT